MKFNLNDAVIISETPLGVRLFDKQHLDLGLDPEAYRKMYRQPDGRLKLPLFEVMNIYGSGICLGSPTPIETEIELVGV